MWGSPKYSAVHVQPKGQYFMWQTIGNALRLLLTNIETINISCVISGFRRQIDENCALLSYYAACSGNFLSAFWENLSVPSNSWRLKMGLDRFYRNVGKKLPLRNSSEERSSQNIKSWLNIIAVHTVSEHGGGAAFICKVNSRSLFNW